MASDSTQSTGHIPLDLTPDQVNGLSQNELLYAIFRAVNTVRNIMMIGFVVAILAAIVAVAASGSGT